MIRKLVAGAALLQNLKEESNLTVFLKTVLATSENEAKGMILWHAINAVPNSAVLNIVVRYVPDEMVLEAANNINRGG